MEKSEEKELVHQFLAGSEVAFNTLAKEFHKKIYWQARRMLGNHEDADEIAQEVLIIMYKKLDKFNFESTLSTWVYKITHNAVINLMRKQKLKKYIIWDFSDNSSLSTNDDFVKNIEDKEKLEKLNEAMKKLPVKQREVFVLRNFDGLSYEEIAEITEKSVGALKANYFHAIKKIIGKTDDE